MATSKRIAHIAGRQLESKKTPKNTSRLMHRPWRTLRNMQRKPANLASAPSLIVSVAEARKLLGESANELTDEAIERLILDLDEIARWAIRSYIHRNDSQSPEADTAR